MNYDAYGLDASTSMIEQAEENWPEVKGWITQAEFPEDLSAKSFGNNNWDGILSFAMLQHIPNSRLFDVLFRMHRILKRRGTLFLSVPEKYLGITNDRDTKGRFLILR